MILILYCDEVFLSCSHIPHLCFRILYTYQIDHYLLPLCLWCASILSFKVHISRHRLKECWQRWLTWFYNCWVHFLENSEILVPKFNLCTSYNHCNPWDNTPLGHSIQLFTIICLCFHIQVYQVSCNYNMNWYMSMTTKDLRLYLTHLSKLNTELPTKNKLEKKKQLGKIFFGWCQSSIHSRCSYIRFVLLYFLIHPPYNVEGFSFLLII